ncbi:MAG: S9 family peptidase [Bacteroidales bacterium]|nr:S9 family peptidase [Bacteroidales bacterium]
MTKPSLKKIPHEMTIHGHTRVDNYYWLKERENPEVIDYLKAENAYLEAMMKHTEPLQDQLFKEITGRIKQDDMSVPVKHHGYWYYTRFEEGMEYPLYCRKPAKAGDNPAIISNEVAHSSADEQVLLDGYEMSKGYAFFDVGGYSISPDNRLIAYSIDTVSRRQYQIFFKEIASGKMFSEVIQNTSGNMVWANDNKTVFYSVKDESLRSCRIMRHEIGTDPKDDVEVYYEDDATFYAFVSKTKSEKYIVIILESTLTSEIRFIDADRPKDEFRVFNPRQHDLLYGVGHYGDYFYILTNADGARNYKIMRTPVGATEKANWEEVIAHREDVLIEDYDIFNDFLVIEERCQGLVNLRVMSWDGKTDYYINFGEPAYTVETSANPEFDTHQLRYIYTSMTTPATVYQYDMVEKKAELLKRQEVVGGFNPSDYVTERLMAPAKDGVMVPISLVYRKGLVKNGDNPLVLYGYGSYGNSMDAYFSISRLSLLDRGFVWAITHVRGGEEMGRWWYEDGKLLKKKNTFTDFIACGEYLIKEGFTNSRKMFAMGGSAGGLLVGAVANMAPELFRGIVAQVPFVDVVTTMLDDSIPLTTGEYDEWGNPNEKEYYDYILSYSPYDNVEAKDYPAMFVSTGLHDSQVQYWEPAKWVAKLRELKTDDNPLYLKTDMDYGHGGASGRFEPFHEVAMEYAFILDILEK